MSPFAASPGDPAAPLERHTAMLQARKDALEGLLATSAEIRAALESPESSSGQDIGELLERREGECRLFAALCRENDPETFRGDLAAAADSDDGGLSPESLRGRAVSLDRDIQQLSEQILACQAECQSIMRARLDALAGAIRESVQRRKVGSAYGPACTHDTPVFLDKQQ